MIMILLSLISFSSWCQRINNDFPLRGINHNDTTEYAKVPVSYIKKANVKLLERKYLLKINNEKDSVIQYYTSYVNNQNIIITELNKNYIDVQNLNKTIQKDLDKQKNKTKVLTYTTVGAITVIVLTILLK